MVKATYVHPPQCDMTLRQWYKGMALQGLLSNPQYAHEDEDEIIESASGAADRMIAEDKENE